MCKQIHLKMYELKRTKTINLIFILISLSGWANHSNSPPEWVENFFLGGELKNSPPNTSKKKKKKYIYI